MKLKLLLLLFSGMLYGVLCAQGPNRSLIISEMRNYSDQTTHVEFTNMGDTPVNLGEFKMGRRVRVTDVHNTPAWGAGTDVRDIRVFLPKVTLKAGESYVIATAFDFGPRMYKLGNRQYGVERPNQIEMMTEADWLLHHPETGGDKTDSVLMDYSYTLSNIYAVLGWASHSWSLFLEHHFAPGDSAIVDQILGVHDGSGGANSNQGYDVAGVYKATTNTLLIRKASIKTGNVEFVRGISAEDSEWQVYEYPSGYDSWRTLWWTTGNHGSYNLVSTTLQPQSEGFKVDYSSKKITVPWGTQRLDDIMRHMIKKPGIVWYYDLNPNVSDSLYRSARTGDTLTIYVCGKTSQKAAFSIVVSEPTAAVNIVVPKDHVDLASVAEGGPITLNTQNGILSWPRVTNHETGADTITGVWFGLPYALRGDTLLKYLEKPSNAKWEFVMVDGVARPDLKNGDKLRVTSQNGSVKEYFIQVQPFSLTSRNFYLASITWPDIPESLKGFFGWKGDTIPSFNSTSYSYSIEIPYDVEGIPALVAKPSSTNAKVDVIRAKTLSGTREDRTISFVVTAENGEQQTYLVELSKQQEPSKMQPNFADPFISEYVFTDQTVNNFLEIVNPGNQILDMSNYMVVSNLLKNPGDAIKSIGTWVNRFDKYVPGYKWGDQVEWGIKPAILKPDINVNPVVMPKDVICWGAIWGDSKFVAPYWPWNVIAQLDVQFATLDSPNTGYKYRNPWGEQITNMDMNWGRFNGTPLTDISKTTHLYLFKILNDSIKNGTKPATDPNDFKLIDAWGMADGKAWNISGRLWPNKYNNIIRKPEIYKGNPVIQASFGTTAENSEWFGDDEPSRNAKGLNIRNTCDNIGQHYMYDPTYYKSTVTSVVYKVSDGYKMETIKGIITGTTVSTFIGNLFKADKGQSLTVHAASTGSIRAAADLLSLNDTLIVLSADKVNTTRYILDVSQGGLSANAVLTSAKYGIKITADPKSTANQTEVPGKGEITGFDYGTSLQTILANIKVPAGASLTLIDGKGAYAPLNVLNFDTVYVVQNVSPDIFFEVLAENGKTSIVYQLKPNTTLNDAFILSTLYDVSEKEGIVKFVPRGTYVSTFFSNITVSSGASAKIVDKMGNKRTEGGISDDDKVVVTSANGLVTRVYYISLQASVFTRAVYLAYVLSDKYKVDQVKYVISGPTAKTLLTEFYANTIPCAGAKIVVVDAAGKERTSGDLNGGDMLKVTSADGALVVFYQLNLDMTLSDQSMLPRIEIYPNPASGILNISGIEPGYHIQVFNAVGGIIREVNAANSLVILTLDDLPTGMYLIVVSNKNKMVGSYKAIIK